MSTRRVTRCLAWVLLLSGAIEYFPSRAQAQAPAPAQTALSLRQAQEMLKAYRDNDGFFWERYINRSQRRGEFDVGERFYQPSLVVNGGPGRPLKRAADVERTISTTAWENVSAFAFARNTEALVIMRAGMIEYERYTSGRDPSDIIAGRSLSKSVIALLAQAAVEDGYLKSLDQAIGDLVPQWTGTKRGSITLRQLLQNTSGLEYMPVDLKNPLNKMNRLTDGRDVFAAALAFEQEFEPGSRFRFHHVDSQLAVMAIQYAVKRPYRDYLSERIWRAVDAGFATMNVDDLDQPRAFCCMRSSAEAWLKVAHMMNNGGAANGKQVLSRASIEALAEGSSANPYFGLILRKGWTIGEPRPLPQAADLFPQPKTPYKASLVKFVGGGDIVMWMVPSESLVILRIGDAHPDWDYPTIPNVVLDDLRSNPAQSAQALHHEVRQH